MDGVTVTVPPFVPLAGATLSQLALSDAVQFMDPPPVLETVIVFAAGLAPPAVAENDSEAGVVDSTGGGGGAATPLLNTTVAISQGVLAPVETRAAGVSPRSGSASSATNSMSDVGETLTRSV
jgi:hypothetical protein